MRKMIHLRKLDMLQKHSGVCVPPDIEVIYIIDKRNDLITMNFVLIPKLYEW